MLIAAQQIVGLLGRRWLPLLKKALKRHLSQVGRCSHHSGCGCLGEKQPTEWRWLLRALPKHAQSRHSLLTISVTSQVRALILSPL